MGLGDMDTRVRGYDRGVGYGIEGMDTRIRGYDNQDAGMTAKKVLHRPGVWRIGLWQRVSVAGLVAR